MTIPVILHRVRDGDTIEVRIDGSALIWPIRLIDCWAPETNRKEQREAGLAAKEYVESVLTETTELWLHVPLPHSMNVLRSLTFDRVPGYIWVGSRLLNQMVVLAGHATSTKAG